LPDGVIGLEREEAVFDPPRVFAAVGVLCLAVLMLLLPALAAAGAISWEPGSLATAVAAGLAAGVGAVKSTAVVWGLAARFVAASKDQARVVSAD
jgi:hypothetical protein